MDKSEYPALFRTFLEKSLERLLHRTQREAMGIRREDMDQALLTLTYTSRVSDAWERTRALLLQLAPVLDQWGYQAGWVRCLGDAIKTSTHHRDLEATGIFALAQGILLQRGAKFEQAEDCFELSRMSFAATSDAFGHARALYQLAGIQRRRRHFQEASRLIESLFPLVAGNLELEGYGYLMQGLIAYSQAQWGVALPLFEKARAYGMQANHARLVAWSLTNLGSTHRHLADHTAAIACYETAIHLLEAQRDRIHYAIASMNLGNIFLMEALPRRALQCYRRAQPILERTGSTLHLANLYLNQAMAYRACRQWKRACHRFVGSLELWQGLGNLAEEANVLDEFARLYIDQGNNLRAHQLWCQALRRLGDSPEYIDLRAQVNHELQAIALAQEGGTRARRRGRRTR